MRARGRAPKGAMHRHRHHIHHLANENSLFHLVKRGGRPSQLHLISNHASTPREKRSSGPNCLTRRLMTTSATGPEEKKIPSAMSSYRKARGRIGACHWE